MAEKTDKALKIVGIIGVVLLLFGIVVGFIGFCLNSEQLFYTGIVFSIFICPAYFVLFMLVLFIAGIIEDKEKK